MDLMFEKKGSSSRWESSLRHSDHNPVRRQLRRAHQMLEIGKHTEAAQIFENLAQKAEGRGELHHTPYLYLQAGRGYLLAGEKAPGSDHILHGLSILRDEKRWAALARSGKRLVGELQGFGFPMVAEAVINYLSSTFPDSLGSDPESLEITFRLPLKCPSCSGVLWPNEIERIEDYTVECLYCGTIIQGD